MRFSLILRFIIIQVAFAVTRKRLEVFDERGDIFKLFVVAHFLESEGTGR